MLKSSLQTMQTLQNMHFFFFCKLLLVTVSLKYVSKFIFANQNTKEINESTKVKNIIRM